jgi:hypothetical protein
MSAKEKIRPQTFRDVRGAELPARFGVASEDTVEVTITPKPMKRKRITEDEIMQLVEKIRTYPVLDPDFTEDDLYDEHGLPK